MPALLQQGFIDHGKLIWRAAGPHKYHLGGRLDCLIGEAGRDIGALSAHAVQQPQDGGDLGPAHQSSSCKLYTPLMVVCFALYYADIGLHWHVQSSAALCQLVLSGMQLMPADPGLTAMTMHTMILLLP